jgi:hypothetical protein
MKNVEDIYPLSAMQEGMGSLAEVKGWSELSDRLPLFESIVGFQNFPLAKDTELRENLRFLCSDVMTNAAYPLTLKVEASEQMVLNIWFDHSRFSPATVERILRYIKIFGWCNGRQSGAKSWRTAPGDRV